MLVLASLHLAALRGHPVLAPIYADARHGLITDHVAAADVVVGALNREPELVRSELHRSTQTNEPGRSAVFQAVIALIAQRGYPSINLVDVGTSAGINLHFDRFPVRAKDDGNPLTLICRDETPVDRSLRLPEVHSRVGSIPRPSTSRRRRTGSGCGPVSGRRTSTNGSTGRDHRAATELARATVLRGTAAERLGEAIALAIR